MSDKQFYVDFLPDRNVLSLLVFVFVFFWMVELHKLILRQFAELVIKLHHLKGSSAMWNIILPLRYTPAGASAPRGVPTHSQNLLLGDEYWPLHLLRSVFRLPCLAPN